MKNGEKYIEFLRFYVSTVENMACWKPFPFRFGIGQNELKTYVGNAFRIATILRFNH